MHTPPPEPEDGFVEAKRAPAKKDTKHFCHGKPNKPHTPDIRMQRWTASLSREVVCRPSPYLEGYYSCYHEEYCTGCGKVIQWNLGRERCPTHLSQA